MSMSRSSLSFFEYHSIDPGAYYGMPYVQKDGVHIHSHPQSPLILLPRSKSKKSFASRIANQIDKLTGGGTIRASNSDKFRTSIVPNQSHPFARDRSGDRASPQVIARRTFRNVVPGRHPSVHGRVFIAPPNVGSVTPKNYYNPWDSNTTNQAHFVHPSQYYDLSQTCQCDDEHKNGLRSGSRCRQCGLTQGQLRRTHSDESLSNKNAIMNYTNNPFDTLRSPRGYRYHSQYGPRSHQNTAAYYDEANLDDDLDYEEAEYIYNTGGRKLPPPRAILAQRLSRQSTPQGASVTSSGGSSAHKRSISSSAKSRQREPSPPAPSPPMVTPTRQISQRSKTGTVTVNNINRNNTSGTRNNSSIIYLTPTDDPAPTVQKPVVWNNRTTVTVNDEFNAKTTIEVGNDQVEFSDDDDAVSSSDPRSLFESDIDTSDKESLASGGGGEPCPRIPRVCNNSAKAIEELERVINVGDENENDMSDYDADCSQLESPTKVRTALTSLQRTPSNKFKGVSEESILEEDEDDDEMENVQAKGSFPQSSSMMTKSKSLAIIRPTGTMDIRTSRLGRLIQESSGIKDDFDDNVQQTRRTLSEKSLIKNEEEENHGSIQDKPLPPLPASASNSFHLLPFLRRQNSSTAQDMMKHSASSSSVMFNDTTRIRMSSSRPSLKDAFDQRKKSQGLNLTRRGISQSFKERVLSPMRANKDLSSQTSTPTRILSTSMDTNNGKVQSSKFSLGMAKPPRASRRERSLSFTPNSLEDTRSKFFNRTFSSYVPKSLVSHHHSLDRSNKSRSRSHYDEKSLERVNNRSVVQVLPSSDSFSREVRDIRKIISSNSSSSTSLSSSTISAVRKDSNESADHIYEEIPDVSRRPLPPLPKETEENSHHHHHHQQQKSIFQGATKYDILHYLEDAKERGFSDADDLDADEDDVDETAVNESLKSLNRPFEALDPDNLNRTNSNRISHISNSSSGSSETPVMLKEKTWSSTGVEIERNDSGLGSESGHKKRFPRLKNVAQKDSKTILMASNENICEDCDQHFQRDQRLTENDSENNSWTNLSASSSVCLSCAKRRCERKEIITEIIDTEIKYGRDLRIIRDEFKRPMEIAGLLTQDQIASIFLNVEELMESNRALTEALKDSIEISLDEGDEDLCSVNIGKVFVQMQEDMLQAFKSYCTRQSTSSALLANLEKEKELLKIFLRVSQMENAILRRMNLSSFLMVPVQRVTKYPLLLSRLLKVTPGHHADRPALQESRERIEHHLEHMNQEAKDNSANKLWRKISLINVASYKKLDSQVDILGTTTWGLRKMALDVLNWSRENREEVNFVLESKLSFSPVTGQDVKRGLNIKMTSLTGLLVTLGGNATSQVSDAAAPQGHLQFPRDTGIRQAALLLIREKNSKYNLVRDPLFLEKCIVCWEDDSDEGFEIQEFAAKETFWFKGDDPNRTKDWFNHLRLYSLSLGNWRRRRNALANIMINGASGR